jgi:hypothetical protein
MNIKDSALAKARNAAADPQYTRHAMTVAQLRYELADIPDDAIVVLAKDSEGNGFSPLAALGVAWYVPESTWAGEIESMGIDEDGDTYEPGTDDLYALILDPAN